MGYGTVVGINNSIKVFDQLPMTTGKTVLSKVNSVGRHSIFQGNTARKLETKSCNTQVAIKAAQGATQRQIESGASS